jgi:hypothetical protein
MGCSCCSSEISKDNSFFSNMRKKRIKQYVHNNNNSTTSKLRIDTIGSVNSINFNGVLNITYKNSNNDKTNKIESSNRIITDLNDSYNSKNTNKNNNKNINNN